MARSRLLLLSSLLMLSAAAADCAPGPGRNSPANSGKMRVEVGEALSVEFTPLPDSPRIQPRRGWESSISEKSLTRDGLNSLE